MSSPSTLAMRRLPGVLVASGGVLFAVGNVLHPLEHSDAAHAAPTWAAAHLTFALGGVLVAAGLPLLVAVGGQIRRSRLAMIGAVLVAIGFAGLTPGAWFEAFVAPLPGGVAETVESGGGGTVNAVMGFTWILATVVFGIAMAWRGARKSVRWAGAGLLVAAAVLIVGPGIPVVEGLWIIPATVLAGVALAVPGLTSLAGPAPAAPSVNAALSVNADPSVSGTSVSAGMAVAPAGAAAES